MRRRSLVRALLVQLPVVAALPLSAPSAAAQVTAVDVTNPAGIAFREGLLSPPPWFGR